MRPTRPATIYATVLALVLAGIPAAGQSPTFTTLTGEVGPGALYEIAMPTAPWNGELVLFAHGIGGRAPGEPVALPDDFKLRRLRDALTGQGFALAYSSYSVNGYGMMKDGTERTHQLRGIFASTVGQPARVYLVGDSMGGLIAVKLLETFPGQYDGALSLCGILAGGIETVRHLADARIVFDYFFPGVTPDTLFVGPPVDFVPGSATYEAVRAALLGGLSSPSQPTVQFAKAAKLPALSPFEMVQGGMSVVGMTLRQPLLAVTHGHMPYDNGMTEYSVCQDPGVECSQEDQAVNAALNAGVARYSSDPSAINYLEHYYTPTGDLRVPLLTLYTARDPISPVFHEERYRAAVLNAGADGNLLQRKVEAFGHCGLPTFAFPEFSVVTDAFSALAGWVRTGVKPRD